MKYAFILVTKTVILHVHSKVHPQNTHEIAVPKYGK